MLDTVKKYIQEIPDTDFNSYYQTYICNVQDENLEIESHISDNTFNDVRKLIARIRKEISNLQ